MATDETTPAGNIFKKGDYVSLPANLRRIASAREGIIASDYATTFEDVVYYPVRIESFESRRRYATPERRLLDSKVIVFVKADDLRLKVQHPLCPSCRCFVGQPQAEEEIEGLEEDEDV